MWQKLHCPAETIAAGAGEMAAATSIVVAPRPHGQGCSRTAGGTDGAANLRAISQQETIAWPCGAPGSRVTLWDAVCPAVPSRAAGSSRCSPEDSLRCRKQVQSQDTALDCAMVEIFCSLIHPHVLSLFATVSEERR